MAVPTSCFCCIVNVCGAHIPLAVSTVGMMFTVLNLILPATCLL